MAALRIGVNALYLIPGGVGGTEIYLRNLLRAPAGIDAENEYFVFTNRETEGDLLPGAQNFHRCPQPVRAVNRPARILWEQAALPRALAQARLDCVLNPGFTAPLLARCPSVTVFHDLQHKRHPEHFRWFDLPFWRMLLYGSAQRSSLLLADSEATRKDVLRFYRVPEAKVRVAPLGVEPRFFAIARERAPERFVLCVSTLHPHKNLERLVRAFAAFRGGAPGYRLVIAGLRGFHAGAVERAVADARLQDAVELTGWLPREELYSLFRRAAAFVYPSTFEGFGIPVLEAMAAGVPLACSSIEPLRSLAGGAAVMFAPEDERAIADALARITCDEDLRARLVEAGRRRASEYGWQRTAEITLEALKEAAGQ
ncbi:MAG: glycosyltransferase family 4 protein [Acidobacteria bacterium]|nr:glycosyltransferase family 4 protein [Acidobacteriota bacterium]